MGLINSFGAVGPQGPAGSGTPLTYSTSERAVGTWVDGKTIYQKTIDCGALPNNTIKGVSSGISGLSRVIDIECVATNSSYYAPLPYIDPNGTAEGSVAYDKGSSEIRLKTNSDLSSFSAYVTLRYTK